MKLQYFILFLFPLSLTSLDAQVILRDTTNQFDYIIITVSEFVNACQDFKAHKETVRGFQTLIVDTTQIYAEFDSALTKQDNIRNFISYAGTFWREPKPKFFLIVGDIEAVPNFEILFPPNSYFNSDFYYRNNIYNNDTTTTDFYIGRIPAQNINEAENYFSKVIEYENINTIQDWMNNSLFICQEEQSPVFNFLGTAFEVSENFPAYVRPDFIFQGDTSVYYGNLDSIYNTINNIGNSTVWFEGLVTDSGFAFPHWFYIEDLNNLTNQSKYFITIFAAHQFSIIDSIKNFTDRLLFLPNAGSIGGVVFTAYIFWSADKRFQNYWAGRLYRPDVHSLGKAVLDSLPLNTSVLWYTNQITNLWADPSLQLKFDMTVSVDEPNPNITVNNFSLEQNYPNPFNPSTKIKYSIPSEGASIMKPVQLKIFDILGNEVATLVNEEKSAGTYEVEFNPENLTSGIYFYQLKAGSLIQTKKMILLK